MLFLGDVVYARMLNKRAVTLNSGKLRKTSLKGVPPYTRINRSRLFTKRESYTPFNFLNDDIFLSALLRTGNTFFRHVGGGMTPGATVTIKAFYFRMFSHAVIACSFISTALLVLRLPARSLVPNLREHRSSVSSLKQAAMHDPLSNCQRENGESPH
jgi:hypothetical protein